MDKQIENYQSDYQLLVQSIQYEAGLDKDETVQALNTIPETLLDLLELGEVEIKNFIKMKIENKRLKITFQFDL